MAVGTQQIDQGAVAAASLQPASVPASPPGFLDALANAIRPIPGAAAPPIVDPPPLQEASLKSLGSKTQESNIPNQQLDSEANSGNATVPIFKATTVDPGKKIPLNLQLPSIVSLFAAQGLLGPIQPFPSIQSGDLPNAGADVTGPVGVKVSAAFTLATQTPSIPTIPSIELKAQLAQEITSKDLLAASIQSSIQSSPTPASSSPAPGTQVNAGLPVVDSIKISAVAVTSIGQAENRIPATTTAQTASASKLPLLGADHSSGAMAPNTGQGVTGSNQLPVLTATAPVQDLGHQPSAQVNLQVSSAENGLISSRATLTSQQSQTQASGAHSNEVGASTAIAGVNSDQNGSSGDLSNGSGAQSDSKGDSESRQAALASTFSLTQPNGANSATVQKTAPLSAPLDSQTRLSVAKQVTDRIVLLNAAKQTQSVTVHLQPEGLGQVEAIIKVAGKDMQAILTASHPEVHAALDSMKSDLSQAATARGLALSGITVSAKHDGFHSSSDSQKEYKQNPNVGTGYDGSTGSGGRKSSGQQNNPKNINTSKSLVEQPASAFLGKEPAPSPRSILNRRSVDLTI